MSVKIVTVYWSHYNTGTNKTEVRCLLEVDTVSDLPGMDDISGYRLTIGCVANIIDTAAVYKINSAGNWYVQQQGTDFYTKSQIDSMLLLKADAASVYTKTQTDTLLAAKSNIIDVYTKSEVDAQCGAIANAGAKNISKAQFTSATIYGVTFTANTDGTVTANSTGTQSQNATLQSTTFLLKSGTYTFSCSPNPQRDVTYDSYVYDTDNSRTIARDNPNDAPGSTFTLLVDTNVRINLRVNRNYAPDNLIFSPMIRYAVVKDNTYVPYAPTNRELYEMILAL